MSGVAVKPNPVFTGAEFVMRARARLSPLPFEAPPSQGVAGLRGDHIMNPMSTPSPRRLAQLRSAAVLVPVMVREGEATLLLTQRTEELPAHAGQVAFPGGKVEEEDETPLHAALREAQEEIGLPPDHAEPLGYLRPYHTTSGFKVIPVVAAVTPGFDIVPDESEVAAVFEARHAWFPRLRRLDAVVFGEAGMGVLRLSRPTVVQITRDPPTSYRLEGSGSRRRLRFVPR